MRPDRTSSHTFARYPAQADKHAYTETSANIDTGACTKTSARTILMIIVSGHHNSKRRDCYAYRASRRISPEQTLITVKREEMKRKNETDLGVHYILNGPREEMQRNKSTPPYLAIGSCRQGSRSGTASLKAEVTSPVCPLSTSGLRVKIRREAAVTPHGAWSTRPDFDKLVTAREDNSS
jgi:hypothetical protein